MRTRWVNKLVYLLLTTFSFGVYIAMPTHAVAVPKLGDVGLIESKETHLPAGKQLISEIRRIQNGQEFKMPQIPKSILKQIEKFFKWIGNLWARFLKRPNHKYHLPNIDKVMNLLKLVILPLAICIVLFVIIHFLLRYRKGVHTRETKIKTVVYPWHYHIKKALSMKDSDPKGALCELVRAVICYMILHGKLPEDPSLTVREIENLLKTLQVSQEKIMAFRNLRSFYENVIFGNQSILPENWSLIYEDISLLIGEEVTG